MVKQDILPVAVFFPEKEVEGDYGDNVKNSKTPYIPVKVVGPSEPFRDEEAHDRDGKTPENVHHLAQRGPEVHKSPSNMICHHCQDGDQLQM